MVQVGSIAGALSSSGTPTMADYWAGKASWKLVNTFPPYAGVDINVVNGTRYIFSRKVFDVPSARRSSPLGTQVQQSTDRGQTWSNPVDIISPDFFSVSNYILKWSGLLL